MSLSGTTGLVGAPYATVNGNSYQGAAYVFRNLDTASGTVPENVKLAASDGGVESFFGQAVSLSGTTALVGAPGDVFAGNQGEAYVFLHLDTASGMVNEDLKLTASGGGASDEFGSAVSLDGDRFVIGAPGTGGAGQSYSGTVSSMTTLDTGNATGLINGVSFVSQDDWIIGQNTSGNQVTLSAGDSATVTAAGKGVYVGQNAGSANNTLLIQGTLNANNVTLGSATNPGDGNTLTIDTAGVLTTGALTLNGASTFNNNNAATVGELTGSANSQVVNAGSLTVVDATDTTFAGTISGDGSLTKQGVGTLTLSGANTYTGDTTVNGGTLAVAAGGSITGDGNLTVDTTGTSPAAMTLVDGGSLSTGLAIIGNNGTGSFTRSGGSFTTNGNALYLGFSGSGTYTLSDSGNGSSLSTGPASIGVEGVGSFTQSGGSFTTNGSTLLLGYLPGSSGTYALSDSGSGSSLTTGGAVIGLSGTGTFAQNGGSFTAKGIGLVLGYYAGSSGTYSLNGGTLNVGEVSGDSGTSTFHFNGGTLQAGASDAPNDPNYPTTFFSGLSTADVQAGGAIINTNGFNVTVAQNLLHDTSSGAPATDGGLTKLGVGTLTLTGANTYTGPTAINAGTLLAANASGSATGTGAVSVNSGGTLGGNGTISGAVTVASGGTLAPGALAVSRLTLGSTLALQSGSTLAITLGGTMAGSGYDQVLVSGTLTLAGTLSVSTVDGFTLAPNETFTILDNTSSTALTAGTFSNALGTLYTDAAGDSFLVNYAANTDGGQVPNDVTLTYLGANVVPEPSAWAFLALGTLGLGLITLRRRHMVRA